MSARRWFRFVILAIVLKAFAVYPAAASESKPPFDTKALIHFDQTNGTTTLISDESQHYPWNVTNTSDYVTTHTKKFGTGSFNSSNTTVGYLSTPWDKDLVAINNNFTLDFWINMTSNPGAASGWSIPFYIMDSSSNGYYLMYDKSAGNYRLEFYIRRAGVTSTYSYTSASPILTTGTWTHVAAVLNDTSVNVFVGGNRVANGTYSSDYSPVSSSGNAWIGGHTNGLYVTNRYIDEFRLINGKALWGSTNFTPPSAADTSEPDYLVTADSSYTTTNVTQSFCVIGGGGGTH